MRGTWASQTGLDFGADPHVVVLGADSNLLRAQTLGQSAGLSVSEFKEGSVRPSHPSSLAQGQAKTSSGEWLGTSGAYGACGKASRGPLDTARGSLSGPQVAAGS